ncbi:MAG: outer membrane lipoprotein carrier protein LolA [Acidobacteriota bacterium]
MDKGNSLGFFGRLGRIFLTGAALAALLLPAVASWSGAPGATEGAAKLKALLAKMQSTQDSIRTLRVSFTQTNNFQMLAAPSVLKGQLILKKPATALYRYTSPRALIYLVKDGDLMMYNPAKKEAWVQDISRHQGKIARYLGISQPVEELEKYFSVQWDGETGGVVRLVLKPLRHRMKKKISGMVFEVHEKSGLIQEFEVDEASGDSIRFTFSNWEINPTLGKDAFQIKLPPDVVVRRHAMDFKDTFDGR